MKVAVVGIGLIGGSLMIDLRKRKFASRITGVDTNMQHRNIALHCGLADEIDSLENAIDKSDLIILATPVNTNCSMLPGILDRIAGTSKVVTDMGSTKGSISEISKDHPARGRFVAAHPMAGTEFSGPLASIGRLDYKTQLIASRDERPGCP